MAAAAVVGDAVSLTGSGTVWLAVGVFHPAGPVSGSSRRGGHQRRGATPPDGPAGVRGGHRRVRLPGAGACRTAKRPRRSSDTARSAPRSVDFRAAVGSTCSDRADHAMRATEARGKGES